MRQLVLWGRGSVAEARARAASGATLVLWNEAQLEALRAEQVPCRSAAELLDLEDADRADEAAMRWTREWGKRPLLDGRSFRELFEWKGVSLWWFAELYLHHSTAATGHVRLIESFHRLLDRLEPEEVEAVGLSAEEALLLERVCTARRALYQGPRGRPPLSLRRLVLRRRLQARLDVAKALASALKARLAGPPPEPTPDGRRTVLFLSHAAFWRTRPSPERDTGSEYEHYFDRLLPEAAATADLRPFVVAVGPRVPFRRRGAGARLSEWLSHPGSAGAYVHINRYTGPAVHREVARAAALARQIWRRLRGSPAVRLAFSHRGVGFADLSAPDLAGMLLLQLPWAVRAYEEVGAVLARVRPDAACLYAESSGFGRAALAACRAAAVPTLGIQHGILYPKYYSYLHDPDEQDCPRPDRTAVFGDAARRFLIEAGRYRPETLVVTGSPKFDALLEASRAWDRDALRARLGLASHQRLVLVASRFKGIRSTHQSIGSAFASLVRAVESLQDARLLVKPHPAERGDEYRAVLRAAGARRGEVVAPGADLTRLLFACDVLVTVESLSAVEALVLGRPVVILNMPTNLREMVEAGVALGVAAGADPAEALRALRDDPATGQRLEAARARYLSDVARGVDGRATERILELIRHTLALARGPA